MDAELRLDRESLESITKTDPRLDVAADEATARIHG